MTLKKVLEVLKKMDEKGFDPTDEQGKCAIVLLSSAFVGPNVKKLAKFCRLSRETVDRFAVNFRKNGIWENGKVRHSGWDDKKTGGIGFHADCAVGLGWLARSK